jgi:hypothetical protein
MPTEVKPTTMGDGMQVVGQATSVIESASQTTCAGLPVSQLHAEKSEIQPLKTKRATESERYRIVIHSRFGR